MAVARAKVDVTSAAALSRQEEKRRELRARNPELAAAYEQTMRETEAERRVPLTSRLALSLLVLLLAWYASQLQYTTRLRTGSWQGFDPHTGVFQDKDSNMEGFEQFLDGRYIPGEDRP